MRVYNFAPGPSALPLPVLEKAAAEMTDYHGTGMSVMEMSHRGKTFLEIHARCQALLRELMHIPDNYKILFIQGGASMQFATIPLNLMTTGAATYIDSGNFAHNALVEAQRYGRVDVLASSREDTYNHIPDFDVDRIAEDSSYLYIMTNNTIFGTRYTQLPKPKSIPLVADMSSNILSQPYDVNDFGLIYAGVQKNMGPAGMAVLIIREDLIGKAGPNVPKMLNYQTYADNDSLFNTPPAYTIYMTSLVLEWLKEQGGVEGIYVKNLEKAKILYDFLDASEKFTALAAKKDRSLMNVTFVSPDKETDARFVKEAADAGLVSLKGHRIAGGMRASIYNAMPKEGVEKLVDFMAEFEKTI